MNQNYIGVCTKDFDGDFVEPEYICPACIESNHDSIMEARQGLTFRKRHWVNREWYVAEYVDPVIVGRYVCSNCEEEDGYFPSPYEDFKYRAIARALWTLELLMVFWFLYSMYALAAMLGRS